MSAKASSSKDPKKTIDVVKPGKNSPSPNSRSIIINNRPVLKDPMMANDTASKSPKEPKLSPATTSKKIEPIDEVEDKDKKTETSAIESPKNEPKDPPKEEHKVEVSVKPKKEDSKSGEGSAPIMLPDEPIKSSEAATPKPEEPVKPASTPKENQPADSPEPETSPANTTTSVDNQIDKNSSKPAKTAEEEKAEKEAAEHKAQMEKLIVAREYFLPINASGKRRTKRNLIAALLLIIILAVVCIDLLLDAGAIHISGIKPVTHFFNNK